MIRFALIIGALSLVLLALAGTRAQSARPATAGAALMGDVNCSGGVNAVDSLQILREVAGLGTAAQCLATAGDTDCSGSSNSVDSLRILRFVAGLSNTAPDGCVAIGEPLAPQPTGEPITVTLSGFGAVSEEIGPGGGALSTTALDGTGYTLDVPEGALLGPELITMTPVDSIDNLPIPGGLVAAVDLQPSGLVFWTPVILTIDPISDIPVEDQTAFMVSDGEFVPHPFVLDSAEMKLPLIHFSTPGVGSGAAGNTPTPSSAVDAYFTRIASILAAERAALLLGQPGDPDYLDRIAEIMSEYYNDVLLPDLLAAASDCGVATRVIPAALGFARQAALLGMDARFEIEIDAAMETIGPALKNCREGAFDRCVDQHDLRAIADIVSFSRSIALFGIDDEPSPMQEMIDKCARFEIDFESWFCTDDLVANCPTGIDYSFRAQDVPFAPPIVPSGQPLGSAQMEMLRNEWGPALGCQGEASSNGSLFQVISGGPSFNPGSGASPAAEITIVINPGIPIEELSLHCDFGSGTEETTLWWQKWCTYHQDELTPPYGDTTQLCFAGSEPFGWGFAITDWQYNGGELYARKIYDRTNVDVGAFEIGFELTTFELWHRPIH